MSAVRIGGASGFWGDSQVAVPQLLQRGNVEFIVFDYLAELTMSLLAAAQNKDRTLGYAPDFVQQVRPHLHEALRKGVRLVSNAGGLNPSGCAAALTSAARDLGLSPKIAIIEGDDLMPLLPQLRQAGIREFQNNSPMPERIQTANAYLGALPIRQALDAGADIVVTGRCVDSAVSLGVLMHKFGWGAEEYDKLAMGSLAGHIIECGCQATGGLHTDWKKVPDWANIGYPIIEVTADASFVITKPEGTGGLVSVPAVAEQILYEIGDPAHYVLPDVVCDFTQVSLRQIGQHRVAVEGAKGHPPTRTYKVSATYQDGFRATAQLTIVGFEAAAKARRTAEAILERTRRLLQEAGWGDYTATATDVLGAEADYGPHASQHAMRDAVMRLAVAHREKRALELFAREVAPSGTSWAPGTVVSGGRPQVTGVLKLFSFLIDKNLVPVTVTMNEERSPLSIPPGVDQPAPDQSHARCAVITQHGDQELVTVPLIQLAYARSGDKGDICNIGLVARSPELLPLLSREVTAERVANYLFHLVEGPVTRYDVPGFHAFNFVCERALGGGGMATLRHDPWGKGMGQILLSMPVRVPRTTLEQFARIEETRALP
jgi:hypothetical protein